LLEDKGDWLLVRSPSRIAGWMRKSDVASRIKLIDKPEEPSVENTNNGTNTIPPGTVTIGTLVSDGQLLKSSQQKSGLLGVVARDTVVKVVDKAGGYLRVEEVQVTGWVSKGLVLLSERSETDELIAKVNTDVLRVRSRPSIESNNFSQLLSSGNCATRKLGESIPWKQIWLDRVSAHRNWRKAAGRCVEYH